MADVKISALLDLGTAPAANDYVPIVDASAAATKRVTVADLFTSPNVTGTLTADGLTVDSTSGTPITFTDNVGATLDLKDTGGALNTKTVRFYNVDQNLFISNRNDDLTNKGNRLSIASNGDISFYEDTGTTAKFFWDASTERLGLGTTAPSTDIHVINSSSDAILRLAGQTGARIQLGEADVVDKDWHIVANNGNFIINETTDAGSFVATPFTIEGGAGNGALYLKSGGNLGIGTTSPEAPLHVNDNNGVKIGSTSSYHLLLKAAQTPVVSVGGSATGAVITTTGTGGGAGHVGFEIPANDANDGFYVVTDSNTDGTPDTLALKISASGHSFFGKTSASVATDGVQLLPNSDSAVTRDNGVVLYLNRNSTDGTIAEFRKDNATVGSIGNVGSNLYIDGGNTGLYLGSTSIQPKLSGAVSDNTVDIGQAGLRFKDLYLSGSAIFGAGKKISGDIATVAQDAVGTFTPPKKGGVLIVQVDETGDYPAGETYCAMVYYDCGATLAIKKMTTDTGSNVDVSTSDVTGTTGTAGKITVAVQSNTIKVENRHTGSRVIGLTYL